jgi:phasin
VTEVSARNEASDNSKNVKPETNEKQTAEMSLFEWPRMAIPFAFNGIAEQGARRVKESSEKMKAVSDEVTGALSESYLNTTKGAADYGLKVMQIANANTASALDFVGDLMTTKSMPEMVQLSTAQLRKNLQAASAQNVELWDLARRVATETAEPIKQVGRVLNKA